MYKRIVANVDMEIPSHTENERLLNHKIILFIRNISHQVSLPTYKPTKGIHAKETKNISTNNMRLENGTNKILVNKNNVGNW